MKSIINVGEWSIKSKLMGLLGFALVGLALVYLVGFMTLTRVKIKGPIYTDIVQMKDLIADVLPPPEYILESYLVVLQLTETSDTGKVGFLLRECTRLESEFAARHEYWNVDLDSGRTKEILLNDAYAPAMEFYRIRNKDFLPLIQSGKRMEAKALALGIMTDLYSRHRAAIDQVVALATAAGVEHEKTAAAG